MSEQQGRELIDSLELLRESIFGRASALYSAAMGAFPFGELPHGSNIEYPNTELGSAQRDAETARQAYYHAEHLLAYAQAAQVIAGLCGWETLTPLLRDEAERLRRSARAAGDRVANVAISNRVRVVTKDADGNILNEDGSVAIYCHIRNDPNHVGGYIITEDDVIRADPNGESADAEATE